MWKGGERLRAGPGPEHQDGHLICSRRAPSRSLLQGEPLCPQAAWELTQPSAARQGPGAARAAGQAEWPAGLQSCFFKGWVLKQAHRGPPKHARRSLLWKDSEETKLTRGSCWLASMLPGAPDTFNKSSAVERGKPGAGRQRHSKLQSRPALLAASVCLHLAWPMPQALLAQPRGFPHSACRCLTQDGWPDPTMEKEEVPASGYHPS